MECSFLSDIRIVVLLSQPLHSFYLIFFTVPSVTKSKRSEDNCYCRRNWRSEFKPWRGCLRSTLHECPWEVRIPSILYPAKGIYFTLSHGTGCETRWIFKWFKFRDEGRQDQFMPFPAALVQNEMKIPSFRVWTLS